MITKLTFILVMISALIHPLWNMLLKQSRDKVVFYLNIHLIFTVLFSFILFIYPVKDITIIGWIFVLASSIAHFFYQVFLCKSYEAGELSLTYPIIRSAPVFVLIAGWFFLKEIPSVPAVIGVIIVVLGVQILNLKELSVAEFFKPLTSANRVAVSMAMFTALFSAGYSIVDKLGVLNVHPVLFFYLFFSISGVMFLVYVMCLKEKRENFFNVLKTDKYKISMAAILEFSSYILILYAFRLSKVAYIIALRQISVVFGVLFGIMFLKESYGKIRVIGSIIVFTGIFLVIAFG